jgi:Co/Zn/Cd efflux system component
MADCCCRPPPINVGRSKQAAAYKRVLWAVLGINAAMFLVELGAGVAAGSASLACLAFG